MDGWMDGWIDGYMYGNEMIAAMLTIYKKGMFRLSQFLVFLWLISNRC